MKVGPSSPMWASSCRMTDSGRAFPTSSSLASSTTCSAAAERVGHLGHKAVDPAVFDHLVEPVKEQVPVIGRVQGSICPALAGDGLYD